MAVAPPPAARRDDVKAAGPGNYYCDYCKTYVRNTPFARKSHEASDRHTRALERRVGQITRDGVVASRERARSDRALRAIGGLTSVGDAPTATHKSMAPPARQRITTIVNRAHQKGAARGGTQGVQPRVRTLDDSDFYAGIMARAEAARRDATHDSGASDKDDEDEDGDGATDQQSELPLDEALPPLPLAHSHTPPNAGSMDGGTSMGELAAQLRASAASQKSGHSAPSIGSATGIKREANTSSIGQAEAKRRLHSGIAPDYYDFKVVRRVRAPDNHHEIEATPLKDPEVAADAAATTTNPATPPTVGFRVRGKRSKIPLTTVPDASGEP
ncbi:hypothetical protein PYCC9005_002679 [Savitreella phatthalungensis]